MNEKQDKLKVKDVNIKLKNYSFVKERNFYYSNVALSDLIGSYDTIISATIVFWSNLTNPIEILFDGNVSHLSLLTPIESMNDWNDNSQISVRFIYL